PAAHRPRRRQQPPRPALLPPLRILMNLHRQQGVMLIEALIGILIFSIGILALIGMQGTAVKNATDARFRSDAAYLANRMAAQMRLDFANISSYPDSYTPNYQPRTDWRTQVQTALPG